MRKPAFCICENKDADQLRGNREADQRLCFRYTDSTIPVLSNCGFPSQQPSSVTVQPGLCRTWSETPKTAFLGTRLISKWGSKWCLQRVVMLRVMDVWLLLRLWWTVVFPKPIYPPHVWKGKCILPTCVLSGKYELN